jgi:hypothetical protein
LSIVAPICQPKNEYVFNNASSVGNIIKAGMASFMFISPASSAANVTPFIEPVENNNIVNITSGVSAKNPNIVSEQDGLNKVTYQVYNTSPLEYDNNHTTSVLLNGFILKGDTPMMLEKEVSSEDAKLFIGNLDYVGHIPTKTRINDADINIVKKKNLNYSEFETIVGNLDFVGKIPKKSRI